MSKPTILILDTSLHDTQAALFENNTCLSQMTRRSERGQAEILFPVLDDVLREANKTWRDIAQVIVTVGPGVFTGIRTGIAAARALRLALGIEVKGVGTLSVLAHQAQEKNKTVLALIDAHKDEAYAQSFSPQSAPLMEPALLKMDALENLLERASAILAYPPLFAKELAQTYSQHAAKFQPIERLDPVAMLSSAKIAALDPLPLYVRAPDAVAQQNAQLKRA